MLVIPKKEIPSLAHATEDDKALLGHLMLVAAKVAKERGLDSGFRVVTNAGAEAGQTVDHLHLHVMGGRKFTWPPG